MFDQFRSKFPIGDEKWKAYQNCFKRIEVPAKTTLLHEGEISKKGYIIEKGCIRAWFNNDGKDITFQFFVENNTVASVESFRKNIPSLITIETIEQSVLRYIHKKDLDKILEDIQGIPALRDKFIHAIFERTFTYMKHYLSFIKDTPTQRYQNFIKENPQAVQRIPQHYIASYLGVTKVHLSRINGALTRKK